MFRGGSRPSRRDGPSPFSQEWISSPPEPDLPKRVAPKPDWLPPILPSWFPSAKTLSGFLVIVLVLGTVMMATGGGSGRPGRDAPDDSAMLAARELATDEAIVSPTETAPTPEQPAGEVTDQAAAVVGTATIATTGQVVTEAPTATPVPTTPAAAGGSTTDPAAAGAVIPNYRILSYYGHPADDQMGILGAYEPEALLAKLREQAEAYEAADPSRPVLLALEVIATVAQPDPQYDGTYLLDTTPADIEDYIAFAEANGLHVILDVQIGRRGVLGEVERLIELGLLDKPFVHLALDPEFAIGEGEIPGVHFGSIDGSEITATQERLAAFSAERGLPPKILIVHQFVLQMITNKEIVEPVPGVQLVLMADGHGPPELKIEVYTLLVRDQAIQYGGIKLFYDEPDEEPLMTPEQVLALDPVPDVIIYQ